MKLQLELKDPDALHKIASQFRSEKKRSQFYDTYAELGDYFRIELDTKTLEARLIELKDWK